MCHPVYIINLPTRTDRREHILKQFQNRLEFNVKIQSPIPHLIGGVSLWLTLHSIVEQEKKKHSPYFIVCEDDHTFTENYSIELLEGSITYANKLEADILSGGVSWFNSGLKTSENLFWIDQFTGMQFTVIYNRFYDKILGYTYDDNIATDLAISKLTRNKWMIYPYISIQTEFGYSDVTNLNNNKGFVDRIFHAAMDRFAALNKVAEHYKEFGKDKAQHSDIPYDITIPTYIINLKERPDRLKYVLSQFDGKPEFDIHIVEAYKHTIGAVGLWESIVNIVKEAINEDDDVIIICEDDHTFTADYRRDEFIHHVIVASEQGADILSGGIGGFGNAYPVGFKRYWVDWLWCTQFIVIYRPFFQAIVNEPFGNEDTADGKISEISSNKMTIFPFISIQHDFGYSDVTRENNEVSGKITEYFRVADKRLSTITQMLKMI